MIDLTMLFTQLGQPSAGGGGGGGGGGGVPPFTLCIRLNMQ